MVQSEYLHQNSYSDKLFVKERTIKKDNNILIWDFFYSIPSAKKMYVKKPTVTL